MLRDLEVEIHYDDNKIRLLDESTLGLYYYSPLSGWLLPFVPASLGDGEFVLLIVNLQPDHRCPPAVP